MKKKINIRYFAMLKEQADTSSEVFETEAKTAEELFEELSKKYHFTLKSNQVRVAINEDFKSLSSTLNAEDSVVFIPPVAGG